MDNMEYRLPTVEDLAEGLGRELRMLAVLRVSRDAKRVTLMQRHERELTEFAAQNGIRIVGWARDEQSATKTSPFQRRELGHWLKYRKDEFDGILIWKFDRLSRNSKDTEKFRVWLSDNGKSLVSVMEPFIRFDPRSRNPLVTFIGNLVMDLLSMNAQAEAQSTSMRVLSAHKFVRGFSYWAGGTVPYGYTLVKGRLEGASVDGKILTPEPEEQPHLKKIFELATGGMNDTDIAAYLNEEHIPTPRVGRKLRNGEDTEQLFWYGSTVRRILANPIVLGEATHKNQPILDATGEIARYVEPIMERHEFERVQIEKGEARGPRKGHELSGVIYCLGCGRPMNILAQNPWKKRYYRCSGVGAYKSRGGFDCEARAKGFRADVLYGLIEKELYDAFRDFEIREAVRVPGTGDPKEIERLRRAQARVREELEADKYEMGEAREMAIAMFNGYARRLRELAEQGYTPDRTEWVPTGKTLWHEWEAGADDWPRRRDAILLSGIVIKAMPGRNVIEITLPDDYENRKDAYGKGKAIPPTNPSSLRPADKLVRARRLASQPDAQRSDDAGNGPESHGEPRTGRS